MLKNYLVVTLRNLYKNKVFTLINILGLGIALSVCIVAFFNHMFNYEFDRTHENFNEIYRVTCFRDMEEREQEYGIIPATMGLLVKNEIPGVENSVRLVRSGPPVKVGDNIFRGYVAFVDPAFIDIFTLPLVSGDLKSLNDHGSVLLSRTMANTLFGKEYPVGKALSLISEGGKEFTYTVGAVFEDFSDNSSFRFDILSHFDNFLLMRDINDADWKSFVHAFFIQVSDKSLIPNISQSLKSYVPVQNNARQDFRINRFNLIPLDEVGENSRKIWSANLTPSLHPAALLAPPVMALFILLIACFNFANTSIATFSKRLKEIGLRKTFGGQRKQLITQFMVETMIICLLALLLGIAFAEFLVPAYSSLWAYMSLEMTLTEYPVFWVFLILTLLFTGFISGVYPAFHVSSFSPVDVLRGTSTFRSSGRLAVSLLTLQFSISVVALVMGIVFSRNSKYQDTLDLGYDRDRLIAVPVAPELFTSLRNEIISYPKVQAAEGTQNHVGFGSYQRPVKDEQKKLEVGVLDIGPSYAQTMGFRLLEGRLFDESRASADRSEGSIIVTKKMADDFGWSDPVGKTITMYDTTKFRVIGVIEDLFISGPWEETEPVMLRLADSQQNEVMVVRAEPGDLPDVLDYINLKWKTMAPNRIFNGMLQEDTLQEGRDINNSITKVNLFLAVTAAILSLIGMYNMVSLDIIRRTKEIGIRKIEGASLLSIMYLISKKYLMVLAISALLGSAGGYYLSVMLLDSIWDYFVAISAGILLIAVTMMFVATFITLILKIARASMKNPVDSLRYE
jgi:ABC-type antimicrobial peptide transport system permease subunit